MGALWLVLKPILTGALAFLRGIDWRIWAGLGILALGLLYGHGRYNAGQAEVQGKFDTYKAELIAKTEAAKVAVKRAEVAQAGAIAAAVDEQGKSDENTIAELNRTVSCLRTGACRVQRRFQCPTSHLSEAPAGAGSGDEADQGGFNAADAEVAFGITGDGDKAIHALTACQAILKAERE